MWMLPQQWLNAIATHYSPDCLAFDQGKRVQGHFDQIKGVKADTFLGILSTQLDEWGADCLGRGLSCGKAIKISAGSGKGHMKMIPILKDEIYKCNVLFRQ